MQQKDVDLSENPSFGRLIRVVSRLGRVYLHQRIHALGIGPPQFFILHTLYNHPGITQEEIVRRIGGDASTLARTIRRLEKIGYIQRRRDPGNRRAYRITVTAAGEAMRGRLDSLLSGYSEMLTRGFLPEEKQAAWQYLQRMEKNILTALKQSEHVRKQS